MVRDTVCNMEVDEKQPKRALVHNGRTYYFCSEGCRAEFERHPEDYEEQTPAEKGNGENV